MQEVSVLSQSSTQFNFRSKGTQNQGRIAKGVVQSAQKKIVTSVIPSKYETIVIKNNTRKAFGTTTNRFNIEREQNTGPGSYISSANTTMDSTVYSKKGLGNGFISKVDRNIFSTKYINAGPGPGVYRQGKPSLSEKVSRNLESRQTLVQFYKKEKKQINKEKTYKMGPGDYDPKKNKIFQNTYTSSFVTKYQRDEYRRRGVTPGPGSYQYQKNIHSPKKYHEGNHWYCRQPTVKPRKPMHELIKFIQKPQKQEEDQEQNLKQSNENWMFQNGIKDRFGDKGPIVNDGILGPGHYPQEQFYSIEQKNGDKNYVTSAVFMSETERQPYSNFEKRLGPNSIVPYLPQQKKDVHLNLNSVWMQ